MTENKEFFLKYPSNTSAGSCHNQILLKEDDKEGGTFRFWIKPEAFGTLEWRFWFSNVVDSTMAEGQIAYHDRAGGNWKICSASIRVAGAPGTEGSDAISVTFDGNTEKDVTPGEQFWSDPVSLTIAEGQTLLWEWTIDGDGIPCTGDSQITAQKRIDGTWQNEDLCPKPDLFGAARPVKHRIAFIGDSITQGCNTPRDEYDHWAGRISRHLGGDYAVWNLGSACGRGADMAEGQVWLGKAMQNDVISMCFGVNDIGWHYTAPNCEARLRSALETLVKAFREAGKKVILFDIPAYDFDYYPEALTIWESVNAWIPTLAEQYGCVFYSISAATDCPGFHGHGRYEPHPTGYGHYMITEDLLPKIGKEYC